MADANLERAAKRLSDIAEDSNIIATLASEVEQTKPRHVKTKRPMLLEMLAEAGRNPAVAEIVHKHSKGMRTSRRSGAQGSGTPARSMPRSMPIWSRRFS